MKQDIPKVISGKSYSYPNFRWWQFIQKRKARKIMSMFTAGKRYKV